MMVPATSLPSWVLSAVESWNHAHRYNDIAKIQTRGANCYFNFVRCRCSIFATFQDDAVNRAVGHLRMPFVFGLGFNRRCRILELRQRHAAHAADEAISVAESNFLFKNVALAVVAQNLQSERGDFLVGACRAQIDQPAAKTWPFLPDYPA